MTTHKFDRGITLYTSYEFPPIPIRWMDWSCVSSEYDGAPDAGFQIIGQGINEQAAIDDWWEQYEQWSGEVRAEGGIPSGVA